MKPTFITLILASVTTNPAIDNVPRGQISHFVETGPKADLVSLDIGKDDGLVEGELIKSERQFGSQWITTGHLKIIQLEAKSAIATLLPDRPEAVIRFFPNHPEAMAGDRVTQSPASITRRLAVTPSTLLTFQTLFRDPASDPTTFELTAEGKTQLRDAAKAFQDARLGLLMVEGYTDATGPSDLNQIESYQRALTVRQFLVDDLGFDPKRVVAFGYGESESIGTPNLPGTKEQNRRIVLKAKAIEAP